MVDVLSTQRLTFDLVGICCACDVRDETALVLIERQESRTEVVNGCIEIALRTGIIREVRSNWRCREFRLQEVHLVQEKYLDSGVISV